MGFSATYQLVIRIWQPFTLGSEYLEEYMAYLWHENMERLKQGEWLKPRDHSLAGGEK